MVDDEALLGFGGGIAEAAGLDGVDDARPLIERVSELSVVDEASIEKVTGSLEVAEAAGV